MKNQKIMRTLALALGILSLPAVVQGVDLTHIGIMQEAHASDNVSQGKIEIVSEAGKGTIYPLSINPSATQIIDDTANNKFHLLYASGNYLRAVSINKSTFEVNTDSIYPNGGISYPSGVYSASGGSTVYIQIEGNSYGNNLLTYNMAVTELDRYSYSGPLGNLSSKYLSEIPISTTYTCDLGEVRVLAETNDTLITFINSSESVPEFSGNSSAIVAVNKSDLKATEKLSSFRVNFSYKDAETGQDTSKSSSYTTTVKVGDIAPTVPKDKYNYKVFDKWDIENDTSLKSDTTVNAIYKDSTDSFWVRNNRYGIIEGTDTVTFLGSRDTVVNVPSKISYGGKEYTVAKLQPECDTREGNIEELSIGASVTIDETLFKDTSKLTKVSVRGNATIASRAFSSIPNIAEVDLTDYTGTSLPDEAFKGCAKLTKVSLGNITSIGNSAFYGCTSLSDIDTNNLTTMGTEAFFNCSSLTSVDINKVETILKDRVFAGCSNLKQVKSNTFTGSVGESAFKDCISLTNLDFSNSNIIDASAFTGCTNLEVVKSKEKVIGKQPNSTLTHRVYFYDEDEQTCLGAFYVKTGTNMNDYFQIPNKQGVYFKKWSRIAGNSTVTNIQGDTTFVAVYGDTATKISSPTLSLNMTKAGNRQSGVEARIY